MAGYRSGARQGKAAIAGTKDTLASFRHYMLRVRDVVLSHGYDLQPYHRKAMLEVGIDPDTGLRIDQTDTSL